MKGKEDGGEAAKEEDKGDKDAEDGDAKNLPEKVRLDYLDGLPPIC